MQASKLPTDSSTRLGLTVVNFEGTQEKKLDFCPQHIVLGVFDKMCFLRMSHPSNLCTKWRQAG